MFSEIFLQGICLLLCVFVLRRKTRLGIENPNGAVFKFYDIVRIKCRTVAHCFFVQLPIFDCKIFPTSVAIFIPPQHLLIMVYVFFKFNFRALRSIIFAKIIIVNISNRGNLCGVV